MRLSRAVDGYERKGGDWDVGEDPATIVVRSRTLQEVRALMYKYRSAVESAVKQGAKLRQQAEAEDENLKALATQMTAEINP